MSTAHQLVRRRRRRAATQVVQDELYGVTLRARSTGVELAWRPSADPLLALAQVQGIDLALEQLVGTFVWRCRRSGLSWDDIAGMLGYTRPAVARRYGPICDELEAEAGQ